ncbi:MAG: hypothetical protein HY262_09845, partial [Chloroflexi bacterium]|nr:hypothetical protein [Chloroflexota bacterium]
FSSAGATDVRVVGGRPDDRPFGRRLRDLVRTERPAGLVILGSGAIPLATPADLAAFVETAGSDRRVALANNRYSADVVAIARAGILADLPDLPGDNALPRWLEEVAGHEVGDLRRRWRLAFDVDGPLDLLLLGDQTAPDDPDLAPVRERIPALRAVAADRRAELLVAGRTSAATLAWLERGVPARVRAFVEERGLRAASRLAQSTSPGSGRADPAGGAPRAPASLLGVLLERDGPASLPEHLERLCDGAILDSRVLLAHRLGAGEAGWPLPEDRFASDLLLADRVGDPWLRELTRAAATARIPILLGGHSLVGPGVRLLLGARGARRWR